MLPRIVDQTPRLPAFCWMPATNEASAAYRTLEAMGEDAAALGAPESRQAFRRARCLARAHLLHTNPNDPIAGTRNGKPAAALPLTE
jgi:hypothetical protein